MTFIEPLLLLLATARIGPAGTMDDETIGPGPTETEASTVTDDE